MDGVSGNVGEMSLSARQQCIMPLDLTTGNINLPNGCLARAESTKKWYLYINDEKNYAR
jgi:hypothetical protein